MKHYRVVYKPLYIARGDGEVEDIGGHYWIQKRSFFGWKDYEQVPQYLSLFGKEAALYHCNTLEGKYKISRMKKFIVI